MLLGLRVDNSLHWYLYRLRNYNASYNVLVWNIKIGFTCGYIDLNKQLCLGVIRTTQTWYSINEIRVLRHKS